MAWQDASGFADQITDSLREFDWTEAEKKVEELIGRLRQEQALFPEAQAKRILRELRAKRRFTAGERLAEAFILSGVRSAQIRRQFAQTLIESQQYAAAEFVLQSILVEQPGSPFERTEARGLLGRIYKQLYVNPGDGLPAGNAPYLQRSVEEYSNAYQRNADANYWPGINLAALVARGRRDGIDLDQFPGPSSIAKEVLAALEKRAEEATAAIPAWEIASTMEALVALSRPDEAFSKANEYIRCQDADAFELASTLRQLEEVWRLTADQAPGARLLPLLRSAQLKREGGDLVLAVKDLGRELKSADQLAGENGLQAVLGDDRFQTLQWYRDGLACGASVARIETPDGKGFGTGFLVRGEDFNPRWTGILLLTNKHVLSPPVDGKRWRVPGSPLVAELPGDARARLEVHGSLLRIEEQAVWSSPDGDLDATFVRLKDLPAAAKPVELGRRLEPEAPVGRVYVIGHPAGQDLRFSMQDNRLIGFNDRLVHYRAPTLKGSSGSPVFDDRWRVVALHHAGGTQWPKLDGSGLYEANEGIAISCLRSQTIALTV